MSNLSKLQDDDRYYNWYHRYTKISLPELDFAASNSIGTKAKYEINYSIQTYALKGSISTQYFGEEFDAENVVTDISYKIDVKTPDGLDTRDIRHIKLHFEVELVSVDEAGTERYFIDRDLISSTEENIEKNLTVSPQYGRMRPFQLQRKVSRDFMKNVKRMPGFKFRWFYIGEEKYLTKLQLLLEETVQLSANKQMTSSFIRHFYNQ